MTLHEAAYNVAIQLLEIGIDEGKLPNVTGIVSIEDIGDGEMSIWLSLDDPNAGANEGIIIVHVDARLVAGVDHAYLLRVLRGWRPSPSLTLAAIEWFGIGRHSSWLFVDALRGGY